MMAIIQIPSGLVSVNDLRDRSCKMTFETRELTNEEFVALRDVRGSQGWLVFSMNEIKEEEIPKEMAEVGTKTPSQRLRAVLFLLWKKENPKLDFDTWYKARMEGLISSLKTKIDV